MAKYRVGLTKTVVYTGTVVVKVTGNDSDAADETANEIVDALNNDTDEEKILKENKNAVDKMIDWYEDSTTYEVEDIEDDD